MTDLSGVTEALAGWFSGSFAGQVDPIAEQNARELTDLLAPLIAEREAKAWDEGARFADGQAWLRENPPRSAVSGEPNV